MPDFAAYLALGDGFSGDLTPSLDLKRADVGVNLERSSTGGALAPVGAASLLFANDASLWPEYEGRDLRTLVGCEQFTNLTADGATIGDIFDEQVLSLDPHDHTVLVTLTAGAVDLQSAMASKPAPVRWQLVARDAADGVLSVARLVLDRFPGAHLLLATLPDPTDGLGHFADAKAGEAVPPAALHAFNEALRAGVLDLLHTTLVDVGPEFHGHGATAPDEDRWFWPRNPTEPNAAGGSALRALWLDALQLD
jgi:hypothetical protein